MSDRSSSEPGPQTPDAELSGEVVAALVAAGLISDARRAEVSSRVAAGTARPEDWKVWLEQTAFQNPEHLNSRPDADEDHPA